MTAHLVVSLNRGWEEIEEEITMPRLRALKRYFQVYPPLHMVVAALAGVKPRMDGSHQSGAGPDVLAMFQTLVSSQWAADHQ